MPPFPHRTWIQDSFIVDFLLVPGDGLDLVQFAYGGFNDKVTHVKMIDN